MKSVKKIAANVVKSPEGDVCISGVPMVDQGQKGYCAAATAGIPSLAFSDSCLRRGVPQRLGARGRRHRRLLLPTEKTTLCCLSKSCRSVCAHHCRQRRDSRSAVTPPRRPAAISPLPRAPSQLCQYGGSGGVTCAAPGTPDRGGTAASPKRQWRFPSLG